MALEATIEHKKKKGQKHFDLMPLLNAREKYGCKYLMAFNGRSDGKTYAVLKYILQNYLEKGEKAFILRRWSEDIKAAESNKVFNSLTWNDNEENEIEKMSAGKWDSVYYYRGEFYLQKYIDGKDPERDKVPFCYITSLNNTEHDKGGQINGITTIFFDEFIAINTYIPNEWTLFQNTISTIVRNRDNVTIFMMGNTISKYCPYFSEMGLSHVKNQKQGTIDVYRYGEESGLSVAVFYAERAANKKPSDVYFAFDNPKLMITSGEWELSIYPHRPTEIRPKDIKFIYFIKFDNELMQCEIVMRGDDSYTYIHRKTTELKNPERDLIYDTDQRPGMNYGRNLLNPANNLQKKIAWFYKANKVFYQDNEVGNIIANYLNWCRLSAGIG